MTKFRGFFSEGGGASGHIAEYMVGSVVYSK